MSSAIEVLKDIIIPQYEQDIDRIGISKEQNEVNKEWVKTLKEALLAFENQNILSKELNRLSDNEDKLRIKFDKLVKWLDSNAFCSYCSCGKYDLKGVPQDYVDCFDGDVKMKSHNWVVDLKSILEELR